MAFLHPAGNFATEAWGGGAEEVGPMCLKSIRVPCSLTKPTGLTTEHALSEPVTPAFRVLPASAAGPAAGTRLCLWVVMFAMGILGISFYKRLVLTGVSRILHGAGTLTLSLGLF